MKRIALGLLLILGFLFVGVRPSHADITFYNGYCFASPDNRLVPCESPTPTPDVASVPIVKDLSVGPGFPGPANTTSYAVTVTSQEGCFPLPEPTELYALGSSSAAALNEILPVHKGSSGSQLAIALDEGNGTLSDGVATINLEVANDFVHDEGLDLKAVWPSENVERVVNVISPVPTSTPGPGTPTATSTPVPTAPPSPTPTVTGTAPPTPSPTAATGPVSVQACVDPPIFHGDPQGGDYATLRGLTSAGASCTGAILYIDGTRPTNFDGTAQMTNDQGLVGFQWQANTSAGGGFARVQCSNPGGPVATACTAFLILQQYDAGMSDADQEAVLADLQGLVRDPAACNQYFGA